LAGVIGGRIAPEASQALARGAPLTIGLTAAPKN
jgi:hypothetical protein